MKPGNVCELFFVKCARHLQFFIVTYIGLAHMDVLLENICFSERYRPVLIDLDHVEGSTYTGMRFNGCDSCMYTGEASGQQHDWIQLGWLLAWALTGGVSGDYHRQTFESLPEDLRNNEILQRLIVDGMQHVQCHTSRITILYNVFFNPFRDIATK